MPDTRTVPVKSGITEAGYLTDSWYLAVPSARLKPGTQERLIVLGEPVVVGRTPAGEAFALRDICPHRLVPLSAGRQIETKGEWTLQCPYHGWRFATDGGCRLMPSLTDDSPYDHAKVQVRRYLVHEASGALHLYVAHDPRSTAPPAVPPPDFGPLPDKPGFVIEDIIDAHMDDAVVGLMDPAHVPFVHNQWWWRRPSSGLKFKEKPFGPIERGWAIERHAASSSSRPYRRVFGGDVQTEIGFQLPGYRWEIVSSSTARFQTLTCLTPEAPNKTRITQFSWWTGAPLLNLAVPLAKRKGRSFLAQEGRRLDLQNQGMAHQRAMLWIDDIDEQAKWYPSLKREWTAARTEGRAFTNPIQARLLKSMS